MMEYKVWGLTEKPFMTREVQLAGTESGLNELAKDGWRVCACLEKEAAFLLMRRDDTEEKAERAAMAALVADIRLFIAFQVERATKPDRPPLGHGSDYGMDYGGK